LLAQTRTVTRGKIAQAGHAWILTRTPRFVLVNVESRIVMLLMCARRSLLKKSR
jgi:hypothetical protein